MCWYLTSSCVVQRQRLNVAFACVITPDGLESAGGVRRGGIRFQSQHWTHQRLRVPHPLLHTRCHVTLNYTSKSSLPLLDRSYKGKLASEGTLYSWVTCLNAFIMKQLSGQHAALTSKLRRNGFSSSPFPCLLLWSDSWLSASTTLLLLAVTQEPSKAL